MGVAPSKSYGVTYSANDYQLAIETTKELEFLLASEFQAEGKGLHEKVSSIEPSLPPPTVRAMRYLASVRNQLIHNREVNALPDRARFIQRFESAMEELHVLIDKKKLDAAKRNAPPPPPSCCIS